MIYLFVNDKYLTQIWINDIAVQWLSVVTHHVHAACATSLVEG